VANDTRVEDLLRQLAPEVLDAVVRRYGSFDLSEDAVQEALVAASLQGPREGVPAMLVPVYWRQDGELMVVCWSGALQVAPTAASSPCPAASATR
jgi:hypothetical protein